MHKIVGKKNHSLNRRSFHLMNAGRPHKLPGLCDVWQHLRLMIVQHILQGVVGRTCVHFLKKLEYTHCLTLFYTASNYREFSLSKSRQLLHYLEMCIAHSFYFAFFLLVKGNNFFNPLALRRKFNVSHLFTEQGRKKAPDLCRI